MTSSAKDIRVAPIAGGVARDFTVSHHYSHGFVQNSQLHLGAFLHGQLVGCAQFGPSMDRRKVLHLVADTPWNGQLELNRLSFIDDTPRNTESRVLSVCMRLIRKHAPHVQWIISFADGTQCGDGTIYRAAGFVLTGINPNKTLWRFPNGETISQGTLTARAPAAAGRIMTNIGMRMGGEGRKRTVSAGMAKYRAMGAQPLPGFQLRYLYFLDPTARSRLTVPVLPFSAIAEAGAGMYKGKPRAPEAQTEVRPATQQGGGGSTPTPALPSQSV